MSQRGVTALDEPERTRHPDRPFRPFNCAHARMRTGDPCGERSCRCHTWRVKCPDCGFTWDNSEGVYG